MCYNEKDRKKQKRKLAQVFRNLFLVRINFLKFEVMKEESPVIADEDAAVKRYSAFVHTARRVLEARLRKGGKSFL